MTYTSLLYLFVYLPGVLAAYHLAPRHHRPKVLLAASYLFFLSLSGKLLVYLLFSTLSLHHTGLWLGCLNAEVESKLLPQKTKRP